MLAMLCRNRVQDFDTWKRVFDSHAASHRAAGLQLQDLWRDADDPQTAVFLFEVMDRARAEAFLASAESAAAGVEAGVLDGDCRFLESL